MAYKDLRDWISTLEEEGELARVRAKVDWNLEIGGINQEVYDRGKNRGGPALLFEDQRCKLCFHFVKESVGKIAKLGHFFLLQTPISLQDKIGEGNRESHEKDDNQ